MNGFPPIQIFILGIAFVILAIPLVQLTGNSPKVEANGTAVEREAKAKTEKTCLIRLRYAHKPDSIQLIWNGKVLIKNANLENIPVEHETALPFPNKKLEMTLTASWPTGTPDTAITVEVEPETMDMRSETRWSSDGQLNEVLVFQW